MVELASPLISANLQFIARLLCRSRDTPSGQSSCSWPSSDWRSWSVCSGEKLGPCAEVRRLRRETGQLTIDDPKNIYAISVGDPQLLPNAWKWRVHLPENHTYYVHVSVGKVPANGYPKPIEIGSGSSQQIKSDECILQMAANKDVDGACWLSQKFQQLGKDGTIVHQTGERVPLSQKNNWLVERGGSTSGGVLSSSAQEFPPDKPVELLRIRAGASAPKYPPSKDSPVDERSDGMLIWIDEQP